jgi:hypothetical protein
MPLCPQITNTPITVVQNADFTVSSVLPVVAATTTQLAATNAEVTAANAAAAAAVAAAAAAAAAAGAAQTAATAALAEATTAYNTAIGSLQPSANTIVNASNQITGINGNGITVYSGSSATTGARVVLNSTGLAGFGSVNITNVVPNGSTVTYTASGHSFRVSQSVTISGLAPAGYNGTFTITSLVAGSTFTVSNSTTATVTDANGIADFATIAISASTGTVNVSGGIITSSTITGGSLNIAGNAIIDANGLLTATGATITGTINAGAGYFGTPSNGFSISSTGLVGVGAGTIVGGTISGTTFTNGSTFSVTSTGVLTATSGTIGGFTLSATSIFSGASLVIESTGNISGGNSKTLFYGFVNIGGGSATGERLIVTGNSSFVGNIITTGDVTAQNNFYYPFPDTVTGTANLRLLPSSTPAGRIVNNGASSQRYKHDIVNLMDVPELDPRKLYELPVRAFRYNLDYLSAGDDRYDVLIPGFIAEEVDEAYPLAADYEETIGIHTWNDRMMIPAMMALIQDLHKDIEILKGE